MVTDGQQDFSGIAALDQPLRRDLYRLLGERGTWVGRDEAAEALQVPRSVAAFHLDRLAEAQIAEVKFERTTGRRGPGAGRPSKLYRRSERETSASVPERHYDLAGELLATAIGEAGRTGAPVGECLSTAAHSVGTDIGVRARLEGDGSPDHADGRDTVVGALSGNGYEPVVRDDGEIALRNCPFHRLAERERSLVCGMNLDLLTGCLEGIGLAGELEARLAPEPGYCCVRIAGSASR
jgi:predicted ArsR family transcriptional regulator